MHPLHTPQIGVFFSLLDDILTPPPLNIQHDSLVLEVGQIAHLFTHTEKASFMVLEDISIIYWSMEAVDSSVVLVTLRSFDTEERILSQELPC